MVVYERIYRKLLELGVIDLINNRAENAKSESEGFMDLSFDLIEIKDHAVTISLAHNFIQNGDVMADPDMMIDVYRATEMAEALTFQQDSTGTFQRVHSIDGKTVNLYLKTSLNRFLETWMKNAVAQGHKFEVPVKEPDWSLTA